jgi:GTP-binding protein
MRMEIEKDLPPVPCVLISSITNDGISQLKDMLWNSLNDTSKNSL